MTVGGLMNKKYDQDEGEGYATRKLNGRSDRILPAPLQKRDIFGGTSNSYVAPTPTRRCIMTGQRNIGNICHFIVHTQNDRSSR